MDNTNWKLLRIKPETHSRLKLRAAQEGLSMGEMIDKLLGAEIAEKKQDEADILVEQLDGCRSADTEIIDMSDWVNGDAPKCCIDTIANDFKPGHVCSDWVRVGYTDKNGLRRQSWFNNRTGEYEFSDRWQKIKAEYKFQ